MAHGAGGKATQTLIEGLLVPALSTGSLEELGDSGTVTIDGLGLAMTTDSYRRAADPLPRRVDRRAGRQRDGQRPRRGGRQAAGAHACRSCSRRASTRPCCARRSRRSRRPPARPGVEVVAGDTKVVERGHADDMYICTAGLGRLDERATLSPAGLAPGDRILLSGPVGDHGTAIMLARGEFELDAPIASDTRSLWPVVDALLESAGSAVHCLRDATRGGVASVLNELARASGVAMLVREEAVPVEAAVAGAAEILGIDPMYVANEGKLVAFVAPERRRRGARRDARGPGLRAARPTSARCAPSRPAWCSWRPRSAAGG